MSEVLIKPEVLRLGVPSLRRVGDEVRLESAVSLGGRDETLWYAVPAAYERFLSPELLDGFLIGLLPLALRKGWDIVLEAPCSQRLLFNLEWDYIPLLVAMDGRRKTVRVIPEAGVLDDKLVERGATGLGFSAGVDSFFTLREYSRPDVPERYRPTHLVFCNVGAQGEWDEGRAARYFRQRIAHIQRAADEVGLPLLTIDSNLSTLLNLNFVRTHTPRTASAILCLQKLFSTFLYSATYSYRRVRGSEDQAYKDIGHADPIGLPLLATETVQFVPTGTGYPRLAKIKKLLDYEPSQRHLNVCTRHWAEGRNCTTCFKCLQTVFYLEVTRGLDKYGALFDLEAYRARRSRYLLAHVFVAQDEPVYKDLLKEGREHGMRFPLWLWVGGRVLGWVRRPLVKWRRRIQGANKRDP